MSSFLEVATDARVVRAAAVFAHPVSLFWKDRAMKYLFTFAAVAVTLLVGVATNQAGDKDGVGKCPVSGKPAVKTSAVDYNGGKVYFCCDNCPKAFTADTAKYAAKANQQLVVTKQAKQTSCPFTGMEVNNDTIIDVGGAKVGFCCQMCQGKAENAGGAQVNLLFNEKAFKKSFTVSPKK